MFIDRRRGLPVRQLEWRVRLMGAGAILAVAGMYFEARWMIWLAIAVLLAGFLLRFLPEDGEDREEDRDDEDPEDPRDQD